MPVTTPSPLGHPPTVPLALLLTQVSAGPFSLGDESYLCAPGSQLSSARTPVLSLFSQPNSKVLSILIVSTSLAPSSLGPLHPGCHILCHTAWSRMVSHHIWWPVLILLLSPASQTQHHQLPPPALCPPGPSNTSLFTCPAILAADLPTYRSHFSTWAYTLHMQTCHSAQISAMCL